MSHKIDNLERADLKINLKSSYIICKKLLSISYQHNAAHTCGNCGKFLPAFGGIWSQSELFSDFSQPSASQSHDDLINMFNPHGQIFQNCLSNN